MLNQYLKDAYAQKIGLGDKGAVQKEIERLKNQLGKDDSARVDNVTKYKIAQLEKAQKRLLYMYDNNIKIVTEKSTGRRGRRPIKIDVEYVKELASYGLSRQVIRQCLGISENTMREWENKPEFIEAFEEGRGEGIRDVAKLLRASAELGNVQAQIFYMKTQAGWRETQNIEHTIVKHEDRLLELDAEYSQIENEEPESE